MSYVDCNDPDAKDCLDALIKEINEELTITCQIPFTVPHASTGDHPVNRRAITLVTCT